jgi:hypothetical protein
VPDPRRVSSETAEGAELLPPVRVVEAQAIARGLADRTPGRIPVARIVDGLDQPVATLEPQHVAGPQRLGRPVRAHVLDPGAVDGR